MAPSPRNVTISICNITIIVVVGAMGNNIIHIIDSNLTLN